MLALMMFPSVAKAAGAAIKLEFGGTSMTIELNQQPQIVTEDGRIVLKTSTMTVALTLPCKVTPIGGSNTAIDQVHIKNNNENFPVNVFTLDGERVGTLKNKNDALSLKKGVYIINGKKLLIK